MNRGGAETWLMHVLRHIDREMFQMDFLMGTEKPCSYDDEIRALGGRIIPCPYTNRPLRYAREFRRILRQMGPYGVVHSHVHHFSGYVLKLAAKEGVRVRIAHSHSTADGKGNALLRRLYRRQMKRWIRSYATAGIAASREAAIALFGPWWRRDPRWRIIHCGIDVAPFRQPVDKEQIRRELGIPQEAMVVGHVGCFDELKNHVFLIEVAEEVVKRHPDTWFLLVGDGALRHDMEALVAKKGLAVRFVFAGAKGDVARLMLGAMDTLLFPSLCEGLPLASLEAQAAGLPCVASEAVPQEAVVIPSAVCRLPLNLGAAEWARVVLSCLERGQPWRRSALRKVVESDFNIERALPPLIEVYMRR